MYRDAFSQKQQGRARRRTSNSVRGGDILFGRDFAGLFNSESCAFICPHFQLWIL